MSWPANLPYRHLTACALLACFLLLPPGLAGAQAANPDPAGAAQPGAAVPINITASQGIEWRQADQEVIATGNAKAVRGTVTVMADQLIAHYRQKAPAPGAKTAAAGKLEPASAGKLEPASAGKPKSTAAGKSAPAGANPASPEDALDNGNTEIYQIDAVGHVHIFTATDNAWGDHAVYNMDAAVLVLTGAHLKLTTPTDVITARDSIEYYSVKRVAVARGDALIAASDGRSIAADTLTGYLAPEAAPASASAAPPAGSSVMPPDMLEQGGKLKKVEAIGHVVIRTSSEMAAGDRGVYLPEQGLARLGGNVHIIHGPNQLNGADVLINTKTGIATLLAGRGGQVSGVIVPNSGAKP